MVFLCVDRVPCGLGNVMEFLEPNKLLTRW